MLETNGLARAEVGNVVRILTLRRVQEEKENVLKARDAEEKVELQNISFVSLNYAKAETMVTMIVPLMGGAAKPEFVPNERTNTIIIRGTDEAIKQATEIIVKLDTRTPQVLIESNIIETTPSFARALGFELDFDARFHKNTEHRVEFRSDSAAQGSFAAGALGLAFGVIQDRLGSFRNDNTVLSAAETEGNIKIISRLSVVTLNNIGSTISSLRVLRVAFPAEPPT